MRALSSLFFFPSFFSANEYASGIFFLQILFSKPKNVDFRTETLISANLPGGYLPYLLTDFNKLGHQINRLDETNQIEQFAIKYLVK